MSGPNAARAVEILTRGSLPPARTARLCALRDPDATDGSALDQALVLWFPSPHSFTGEDVAEFHTHGSPAVRAAILRVLAGLPGCRHAEPGEFTRRAFANGKLDLTAVEGLADLIEAETESQRKQALRQLEGTLARQVVVWRESLIDALAVCEATLDFSDEGDVPTDVAVQTRDQILSVISAIGDALASARRGERIRSSYHVVLAGKPNAGKSSLFNAIARRDVAIVSPIAGTTRDAIELRCDLDGLPVTFVDTAGLRDSTDPIEQMGVARTLHHAHSADLVLLLRPSVDDDEEGPGPDVLQTEHPILIVGTKADLRRPADHVDIVVSALTGEGLDSLLRQVRAHLLAADGGRPDPIVTRERHRAALAATLECLQRIVKDMPEDAVELVAEELRLALRCLGRITGEVDVEDVLDRIFADFCIGK